MILYAFVLQGVISNHRCSSHKNCFLRTSLTHGFKIIKGDFAPEEIRKKESLTEITKNTMSYV